MYTLKVSYGYVDEPETSTTEILGNYETRYEAAEAAQDKLHAIVGGLAIRFCSIEGSRGECYVTYGYYDAERGRVVADHYYEVSVIER